MTAATATRKPRLTYRQQAYALAVELGAVIVADDNLSGLHGEIVAPAGWVFAETGEATIGMAFDGKREAAWPLVVKALKKGLEPAPVEEIVEPTPAGLVFAAPATTEALLAALTATMTSREVAGWKRAARAYGPHGLTAEYRAKYHQGWAAAGKATFRLSAADREVASAGFLDGFDDRRNGCEAWATPSAVPTGRQEQAMGLSEVTL